MFCSTYLKHSQPVSSYFQSTFLLSTRNSCIAPVTFPVSFVLQCEYRNFNYFYTPAEHKVKLTGFAAQNDTHLSVFSWKHKQASVSCYDEMFFLIYDKPILTHSFKNCLSKLERHN